MTARTTALRSRWGAARRHGGACSGLAVALSLVAGVGSASACHRDAAPPNGRAEAQSEEHASDRLEREVRAKLSGDPELAGGGSIVVIVDGGRVVLEGWVASTNERTLAEADAATVVGVSSVDDRLLIRRTP